MKKQKVESVEPVQAEPEVKYPNIRVKLVGENGNAFFLVGKVKWALQLAGVPKEEIDKFLSEATSGDYNNVIFTCMKWVNVE